MKKTILFLLTIFTLAACSNYGKKAKSGHIEMYYRQGITEAEAIKAASVLEKIDKEENNNSTTRRSFQLLREGDTATLRMVVDEKRAKDMPDDNFLAVADVVSEEVFSGKPVNMDLTTDRFKTIRHITYRPKEVVNKDEINAAAFGPKIKEGNVEVYMKGSDEEEAKALAAFANGYFKPENTFSYQLVKDDIGNYTVKMVANLSALDKFDKAFYAEICKGICDSLHIPAVRLEMTDHKFEMVKAFNYPADTGDSDLQN